MSWLSAVPGLRIIYSSWRNSLQFATLPVFGSDAIWDDRTLGNWEQSSRQINAQIDPVNVAFI